MSQLVWTWRLLSHRWLVLVFRKGNVVWSTLWRYLAQFWIFMLLLMPPHPRLRLITTVVAVVGAGGGGVARRRKKLIRHMEFLRRHAPQCMPGWGLFCPCAIRRVPRLHLPSLLVRSPKGPSEMKMLLLCCWLLMFCILTGPQMRKIQLL